MGGKPPGGRVMTIAGYMLDRLDGLVRQWDRSLVTLPQAQFTAEREELRRRCEGQLGPTPAAMLLKLFDGEIARRRTPEEGTPLL